MTRVVIDIPDSIDLFKVNDIKLCIRYYKDNDNNEYSYVTEGFAIQEERPQGEFVKLLNKRITEHVCKWCQMDKHCELCEISRVFMIIALTDEEMKGSKEE